MQTVEEILAAQQAIVDGAEDRPLTDDEVAQFEALEVQLRSAQRSEQIRARQSAYMAPAPGQHLTYAAPERADDGLEAAFVAYLRTGQPNADIADLAVSNDMGVGTSAGGGYTVPAGFRQKLVETMKAYGGLAAAVDSFDTGNGAPIEYPSLDDTANSGAVTGEGAAPSSGADLTFGSVKLGAYDYTSSGPSGNPIRVSWALLQDSAFDVVAMLTRAMGTRIARAQAAHWCTGTGVGQPLGLVGSVTADATLATLSTLIYDDLLDAEDALDPAYEQNAAWVMNKGTWTGIRGVVDSTGRPLVMAESTGIGGRVEKSLLGYPVIIDQGMPAYTTAGNPFAVLGDLREAYVIRRVSNPAVIVNPWTRANYRQTEFTAWQRADGTVQNRAAYSVLGNHA